mgnify:CR=1 FL=1
MRLKTILKSIFIVLCFSFLFISCGEKKETEEVVNEIFKFF